MKRHTEILICAILIAVCVIANVHAIFSYIWKAQVTVRVGSREPHYPDLIVVCEPSIADIGDTITIKGNLFNATSREGILGRIKLYYKRSDWDSWAYIASVLTDENGLFSYQWKESSSLSAGVYVINGTFEGNNEFKRWTSVSDLIITEKRTIASDFSITVSPYIQNIFPGEETDYVIKIASIGTFSSPVSLTASIFPETDKITSEISPSVVKPPPGGMAQCSILISTQADVKPGTYEIRITGIYGNIQHYATTILKINLPSTSYFGISASPLKQRITPGETTIYTIIVNSFNGFHSAVTLTGTVSPSTSQLMLVLNPEQVIPPRDGNVQSELQISTTPSLAYGEYTIIIKGYSDQQSDEVIVKLEVIPPIDWEGMLDRFSELKTIYETHRKCFFNNSWWIELSQGLAEATLGYDMLKEATEKYIDAWSGFLELASGFPISPLQHMNTLGGMAQSLLSVYSMFLSIHLYQVGMALWATYPRYDIRRDLDNLLEKVNSVVDALNQHNTEALTTSMQQLKQITEEAYLGTKNFDTEFYNVLWDVMFLDYLGFTSRTRIYEGIRPHVVNLREALILSYMEITYFLGDAKYLYEEEPDGYLTSKWNLPIVKSAYWEVNGEKVDVAEKGQEVVAHVILRSYNCSSIDYDKVEGSVTIIVKKDIRLWFDQEYAKGTYNIQVGPGETIDLTLSFTPDEASSLVLRGYFIEVIYSGAYVYPENMVSNRRVEWESGSVGAMKNSYPPRLTVREPSGTLETSGTVIALEESQHHLYLHVYDDEGRHTGFNYAKGIIENQIPNSQFYMYERVSLAVIPSNVTNFKVIIDAKYAQYTNESYKLTVMTIENLEVKNQTTTTATILKGAIQQYSIEILPQKIPNIKPYSETPLNWLILCIIGITIIISTTLLYYSRKRKNADK